MGEAMPLDHRRLAMSPLRRLLVILPLWLGLGGWTFPSQDLNVEPPQWQGGHIESLDPMWNLLNEAHVAVDRKRGAMVASFPGDLQQLNGRVMKVEGFILPLETGSEMRHFALTRRNSGCPFCPPNLPTEAVEVTLLKPIKMGPEPVTITGTMTLRTSSDAGLFYEMRNAKAE
jgi:hypothetical protein